MSAPQCFIATIEGYHKPDQLFFCEQAYAMAGRVSGDYFEWPNDSLERVLRARFPDLENFRPRQPNHKFRGTAEWRFCTNCFRGVHEMQYNTLFVSVELPEDLKESAHYRIQQIKSESIGLVCSDCIRIRLLSGSGSLSQGCNGYMLSRNGRNEIRLYTFRVQNYMKKAISE